MRKDKFNEKQVGRTLNIVLNLLRGYGVEYRMLGSVVASAINGYQYRELGDIDLLVDKSVQSKMLRDLKLMGYWARGGIFSFGRKYLSTDSLDHSDLLEVGMFWGRFEKNGSFVLGKYWKTWVDGYAILPTEYELHGVKFLGLPAETIASGIMMSPSNPKRVKELEMIKRLGVRAREHGYMHMSIFGVKVDWLYYLIMAILNLVGLVRVKMGKPFDPWR